ncbi:Anoctamin-7 [Irineochytrium annulatum]|nr:Anoctamin-7 [Irineochytrium annulatum]
MHPREGGPPRNSIPQDYLAYEPSSPAFDRNGHYRRSHPHPHPVTTPFTRAARRRRNENHSVYVPPSPPHDFLTSHHPPIPLGGYHDQYYPLPHLQPSDGIHLFGDPVTVLGNQSSRTGRGGQASTSISIDLPPDVDSFFLSDAASPATDPVRLSLPYTVTTDRSSATAVAVPSAGRQSGSTGRPTPSPPPDRGGGAITPNSKETAMSDEGMAHGGPPEPSPKSSLDSVKAAEIAFRYLKKQQRREKKREKAQGRIPQAGRKPRGVDAGPTASMSSSAAHLPPPMRPRAKPNDVPRIITNPHHAHVAAAVVATPVAANAPAGNAFALNAAAAGAAAASAAAVKERKRPYSHQPRGTDTAPQLLREHHRPDAMTTPAAAMIVASKEAAAPRPARHQPTPTVRSNPGIPARLPYSTDTLSSGSSSVPDAKPRGPSEDWGLGGWWSASTTVPTLDSSPGTASTFTLPSNLTMSSNPTLPAPLPSTAGVAKNNQRKDEQRKADQHKDYLMIQLDDDPHFLNQSGNAPRKQTLNAPVTYRPYKASPLRNDSVMGGDTTTGTATTGAGGSDRRSSGSADRDRETLPGRGESRAETHSSGGSTDDMECSLIEEEAFGPGSALLKVLEPETILTTRHGKNLVHFMFRQDQILFEEIVAFQRGDGAVGERRRTYEEAMDRFGLRIHGDALVMIAYETKETHWDAVLKYDVLNLNGDDDGSEMRSTTRLLFERELLRHHLIIVRERGLNAVEVVAGLRRVLELDFFRGISRPKSVHGLSVVHHLKIIAPFETLGRRAERIKLQLEVDPEHRKVSREQFYHRLSSASINSVRRRESSRQKSSPPLSPALGRKISGASTRTNDSNYSFAMEALPNPQRTESQPTVASNPEQTPTTYKFKTRAAAIANEGRADLPTPRTVFSKELPSPDTAAVNGGGSLFPVEEDNSRAGRKRKRRYREGPDGTFIGSLRFIFSLVPVPLDVERKPFQMMSIDEFLGGDERRVEGGKLKVKLSFFSSEKRNLLVHVIVQGCRIKVKGSHFQSRKNVGINDLLLEHCFTDFYALHDGPYACTHILATKKQKEAETESITNDRAWLYRNWCRFKWSKLHMLAEQPLPQIRNYFGEQVAWYFAWLGFYTLWLYFPTIIGLVVFIYGAARHELGDGEELVFSAFDNGLTVPFAFFMALWVATFLEFWKRQEATLRTVWDVIEVKTMETRRPEWYGTVLRRSPITGKIELHFPRTSQAWIFVFTHFVLFMAILVMISYEVFLILIHTEAARFGTYISSVMVAALTLFNIIVLTPLYLRLSYYLNRIENHKTVERFQDFLIAKNFVFSFVNNYSGLIYVGILKVWVGGLLPNIGVHADVCVPESNNLLTSCMASLMLTVMVIFVGLQFFNQLRLVFVPLAIQYLRRERLLRAVLSDRAFNAVDLSQVPTPKEGNMDQAQHLNDGVLDTWQAQSEFGTKVIQVGFVALFSCAFPLAPLLALINNLLEIRFGSFRLVAESRRPFVLRTTGVGAWNLMARFVSRAAVLINGFIVAFSSRYFSTVYLASVPPAYRLGAQLLFVIVFEHLVLLSVWLIDWLTPDIPGKVAHAVERQKYLSRLRAGEAAEEEDEIDADGIAELIGRRDR